MRDVFWEGFHDEIAAFTFRRSFAQEIKKVAMEKEAILPLIPIGLAIAGVTGLLGGAAAITKPRGVSMRRWYSWSDVGKTLGTMTSAGTALVGGGAVLGAGRLLAGAGKARSALTAARGAYRPGAYAATAFRSPAAGRLAQTIAGGKRLTRLQRVGGAADIGFGGLAGSELAGTVGGAGQRLPGVQALRPRRISAL